MRSALRQITNSPRVALLIDNGSNLYNHFTSLMAKLEGYELLTSKNFSDAQRIIATTNLDTILFSCAASPIVCHLILKHLQIHYPDITIIAIGNTITDTQSQTLIDSSAVDYLSAHSMSFESLVRSLRYAEKTKEKNFTIDQLLISDPLTLLGNRQFFFDTLTHKLNSTEYATSLVLITLDLDSFSQFNARYGVSAGDLIVSQMGQRLRAACSNEDVLARVGSDEFAVILPCQSEDDIPEKALSFINAVIDQLVMPYHLGTVTTTVNCSIGVALAPQHGSQLDELTRKATIARYNAKQVKHCSYAIYRDSMADTYHDTNALEPDLIKALRSEEFTLFYQPRIDVNTGRIVGAEALIRWQHPSRGLVMPGEFIPTCEHSGLIVPIGYWVIHQAGRDLNTLKSLGLPLQSLGVNLSFRQFHDDHLVSTIRRIIQQNNIDTSVLEFELTESAIFNDEEHVRTSLDALSQDGITFSLDDFGTGYSSFSLLHKLPISTLKIDRSFVNQVDASAEAAEIVRTIINLGQNMNMQVIAEGAETQQQVDFLAKHQCQQVQGYYYSPPVSFDTFMDMLKSANNHDYEDKTPVAEVL